MPNYRKLALYVGLGITLGSGASVATCKIEARRYDPSRLPCAQLNLPKSASKKPLEESICIAVSGEQPLSAGVETKALSKGRIAHTLFLEWDHDGITEWARRKTSDVEPITVIIDKNSKAVSVQVRSHWRVGEYDIDPCRRNESKVPIAISDAFHTPIIAGCHVRVSDPIGKGKINTFVFNTVVEYGKAIAQYALGDNDAGSFAPLQMPKTIRVPGPNHPSRTQPLFSEK